MANRPDPLVVNLSPHTKHVLVSTAIGGQYLDRWRLYVEANWTAYAARHDLAVIIVTQDIDDGPPQERKNGAWQKLLAPNWVRRYAPSVQRLCLLDTDILISPIAPNIFQEAPPGRVSVVSQEQRLPYVLTAIKRRIAFFRHRYYSSTYPLDSLLHATPGQLMSLHHLSEVPDYFCSGLMVMDAAHGDQMESWYRSVTSEAAENSSAWEEPYLNSWVQSTNPEWLPYEFQAIWNYEMAWRYPFLYEKGKNLANDPLTRSCVENSLWNNHFIHFAGSWYESLALNNLGLFEHPNPSGLLTEFAAFSAQPLSGRARGKIVPKSH